MLTLRDVPDVEGLRRRVSAALADYRIWRGDVPDKTAAFQDPVPVVRWAFPRWVIPGGQNLQPQALAAALEHADRWHLQIHVGETPQYYARARYAGEAWSVEWFGEAWLAQAVDRGMRWLEENARLYPGEVRLISSRLYEFTSFWLHPSLAVVDERYVVVHASARLQGLPLLTPIRGHQLKQTLISRLGAVRAAGGLL